MKYDDLSFEVEEDGKTFKCDILEVIPNKQNSEEPYVVYTNYMLDDQDQFVKKYGRLVKLDEEFYIETHVSDEEIQYIHNMEKEEVVEYVNQTIQEALE